jgi:hypothetical protein
LASGTMWRFSPSDRIIDFWRETPRKSPVVAFAGGDIFHRVSHNFFARYGWSRHHQRLVWKQNLLE